MVLHQNNRFIYNNTVAVRIPNNLCFDYCPEGIRKEAIELISPDESFQLIIGFQTTAKSARTFEEEGYEELDFLYHTAAGMRYRGALWPYGLYGEVQLDL